MIRWEGPAAQRDRDAAWARLLAARRARAGESGAEVAAARAGSADPLFRECYGGLVAAAARGPLAIAQIGQSLDGRIAAVSGHSRYINGPEGLDHLHRLRALADAVVVGASTADLDDPQLTVRRVEGPDPARVVIDPRGRVPAGRRMFRGGGAPAFAVVAPGARAPEGAGRIEPGSAADGAFRPRDILAALRARGYGFVLVEGGAATVSRFLAAGALDRLHVTVSPLVLGSGRPGLELPPVARVDEALRPPARTYRLGADILFDCDLGAAEQAAAPAHPGARRGP